MGTGPYQQPRNKSALPWILGGVGALAVIALALVLAFVVFKGGGKGDASGPEQVVRDFYAALEKGDADMLVAAMEPSFREELEAAFGKKYKQDLQKVLSAFFPQDMKVEIRKMETKIDGDTAVVRVTDGTVTYTDESGEKVSEEASEGEQEPLRLVRVEGKWYLAGDYLRDSGFDPEELAFMIENAEIEDGETQKGDETASEENGEDKSGKTEKGEETASGEGGKADLKEIEKAMLEYARQNSPQGIEMAVIGLLAKGKEAVGFVHYLDQEASDIWIIMKKDANGWYGDGWFVTDLALPDWYKKEEAAVEKAMVAYTREHAAEELEFEIEGLMIRGDEACALAIPLNIDTDAPLITMRKGPQGWYGVEVGTGGDIPAWYDPYLRDL